MNERKPISTTDGAWIDEPEGALNPDHMSKLDPEVAGTLQWVHALLQGSADDEAQQLEHRVEAVVRRLGQTPHDPDSRQPAPVAPTRLIWRGLTVSLIVAASLLLIVALPQRQTSSALLAVERAARAWAEPVSREYRVGVQRQGDANPRWTGRLVVRGNDHFVLDLNVPLLGRVLVGSDGRSTWWLFPQGPVFVDRAGKAQGGALPRIEAPIDTEFLKIAAVLQRLAEHYHVFEEETGGDGDTVHIVALRRRQERWQLPRRVDIWSNRSDGVVRRIVMQRDRAFFLPLPHSIKLELVGPTDVDPNWFQHAAHHEADREVRYVEAP